MRLSEYPYVVVRIGCSRCARRGQYRLARLAEKYGSEITMPGLLCHLAADCEVRPPDVPAEGRPKLRVGAVSATHYHA